MKKTVEVSALIWLLTAACTFAMGPAELRALLARKDGKPTVIDIRPNAEYRRSHIPGAINIPASVIAAKKLPRLGKVVVYDAGLVPGSGAEEAAEALNGKPGITAEVLKGGYAAWQTGGGSDTRGKGLRKSRANYVSYKQVKALEASKVVLVDLRGAGAAKGRRPTDLREGFPGARVTRRPAELQSRQGKDEEAPIMVLIDNMDGKAEETARQLRARGITRVVILAGGEEMVDREGRAGMKRRSESMTGREEK